MAVSGKTIGGVVLMGLAVMFLADGALAYSGGSFLWPDVSSFESSFIHDQASYSYLDFGIGALLFVVGLALLA
jgi:hypothetical protein